MRIYDLLTHNERSQLMKLANGIKHHEDKKKRFRRNSERYSKRQWENIMGVHRDRYHKVSGKVKRK